MVAPGICGSVFLFLTVFFFNSDSPPDHNKAARALSTMLLISFLLIENSFRFILVYACECFATCMFVPHVRAWCLTVQKRVSDALELQIQTAVSYCVGAGNGAQV